MISKEKFSQVVGVLQSVFGVQVDKKILYLYEILKNDMTDEEFELSAATVMKSFIPTSANPFPAPANFVNAIGGGIEDRARKALNVICSTVAWIGGYLRVSFGPAVNGVVMSFGGWPEVAGWNKNDWNINEGRLLASIETAFRERGHGPDYLPGLFDRYGNPAEKAKKIHRLEIKYPYLQIGCVDLPPMNEIGDVKNETITGLITKFTMGEK